jgi:SAM-dependent methyltransferase
MGFFTLELARAVGPGGRVVAVDIQPRMIARLKRRATRAGLNDRIDARLARPESMELDGLQDVDLVFAFAVVHELPDAQSFFGEAAQAMKSGADFILAEPRGHVSVERFDEELKTAAAAGLHLINKLSIPRSHSALLKRG